MAKLVIMPCGYFASSVVRECNQSSRLILIEREWLLHIHMASPFQTQLGDVEMSFRRGCDMDNVWLGLRQELGQVTKVLFDRKPLAELLCHRRLRVAQSKDFASRDPFDLRSVRICDFPTSYDSYLKHSGFLRGGS